MISTQLPASLQTAANGGVPSGPTGPQGVYVNEVNSINRVNIPPSSANPLFLIRDITVEGDMPKHCNENIDHCYFEFRVDDASTPSNFFDITVEFNGSKYITSIILKNYSEGHILETELINDIGVTNKFISGDINLTKHYAQQNIMHYNSLYITTWNDPPNLEPEKIKKDLYHGILYFKLIIY